MLLTLGWNQYVLGALMVIFLIICGLVILTILVQRPQGGGLAGAFGGGSGSGQTAFGTKTGDALTVLTISMFAFYLVAAILLNYGFKAAANPSNAVPSISAPEGTPPVDGAAPATTPPTTPPTTPESPATTTPEGSTTQTPPAQAPATPAPETGTPAAPPVTPPATPAPQ